MRDHLIFKKVRSAYGAEDGDAVSICYTDRCTPPAHVWVHTDRQTNTQTGSQLQHMSGAPILLIQFVIT